MEAHDLEAIAVDFYTELDEDPEQPKTAFALARAWPNVERVERVHALVGAPAKTFSVDGRARIAVKRSLADEYANFYVAHELAHLLLARATPLDRDDEEHAADYLAACLLLPRPAVVSAYRADGFAPRALAERAVVTQTAAALRLAEAMTLPLAAVSPQLVRVRGPESFVWPDELTVRRWAVRPRPGLARVRLTDQRGRVALVADDCA